MLFVLCLLAPGMFIADKGYHDVSILYLVMSCDGHLATQNSKAQRDMKSYEVSDGF